MDKESMVLEAVGLKKEKMIEPLRKLLTVFPMAKEAKEFFENNLESLWNDLRKNVRTFLSEEELVSLCNLMNEPIYQKFNTILPYLSEENTKTINKSGEDAIKGSELLLRKNDVGNLN